MLLKAKIEEINCCPDVTPLTMTALDVSIFTPRACRSSSDPPHVPVINPTSSDSPTTRDGTRQLHVVFTVEEEELLLQPRCSSPLPVSQCRPTASADERLPARWHLFMDLRSIHVPDVSFLDNSDEKSFNLDVRRDVLSQVLETLSWCFPRNSWKRLLNSLKKKLTNTVWLAGTSCCEASIAPPPTMVSAAMGRTSGRADQPAARTTSSPSRTRVFLLSCSQSQGPSWRETTSAAPLTSPSAAMDRPYGRAYKRHIPRARHRKPEPTFFSSYSQATSDVPALRMSSAPSVRILSAPRSMEIWERRCFSAPLLAMTVDGHPFLKLTQFFLGTRRADMHKNTLRRHSSHLLFIVVFTLLRVGPTISSLIGMTLEISRPTFERQLEVGRRVACRALSVECGSSLDVRCSRTWQSLWLLWRATSGTLPSLSSAPPKYLAWDVSEIGKPIALSTSEPALPRILDLPRNGALFVLYCATEHRSFLLGLRHNFHSACNNYRIASWCALFDVNDGRSW